MAKVSDFHLGGEVIKGGQTHLVRLPVATVATGATVQLDVHVIHGRKEGPTLVVMGALHGDEINGTEVCRRLLRSKSFRYLHGTLLIIPVVNSPAFLNRSRYLPDRRDLNRLFPGGGTGSLGARLANKITTEILPRADFIIDLHTAAADRTNLSQIRVTEDDEASMRIAAAFRPPVVLMSSQRPGTLRGTCAVLKKPVILYESGEAGRLDAHSIRFGQQGVVSVMREVGMLPKRRGLSARMADPVICQTSQWERASEGGLFIPLVSLGKTVTSDQEIGYVGNPVTGEEIPVKASRKGVVIGRTNQGLVDEGDALFHIGITEDYQDAEEMMAQVTDALPDLINEPEDDPVSSEPFMES